MIRAVGSRRTRECVLAAGHDLDSEAVGPQEVLDQLGGVRVTLGDEDEEPRGARAGLRQWEVGRQALREEPMGLRGAGSSPTSSRTNLSRSTSSRE